MNEWKRAREEAVAGEQEDICDVLSLVTSKQIRKTNRPRLVNGLSSLSLCYAIIVYNDHKKYAATLFFFFLSFFLLDIKRDINSSSWVVNFSCLSSLFYYFFAGLSAAVLAVVWRRPICI